MSATSVKSDLYRLIDATLSDHESVQITDKRCNAILLAEDDSGAIQDTLYLLNIPSMRDSIRAGMKESFEDCSNEIDL